jgi:N-acetylneuraminate synthase
MRSTIFEDLFVLEFANNHWGKLERGLQAISDYSKVVRFNNVRAAFKLQFRNVESFIHKDFRDRADIRYIKKTLDTRMPWECFRVMLDAVRKSNMITMVTPFDEMSVEKCVEFNVEIIKIASSDIKDWFLIEKIATTGKPVAISTGGSSLRDMDAIVAFFNKRNIPLAVNHCVSLYPSEDSELEINQIDFLRNRYPDNVIGFSTHEKTDWSNSVMLAHAKGARTFERHVDIDYQGVAVSPYCSLPHQVDEWFKAFLKAQEMCGAPGIAKRQPPEREVAYLDGLVRGVYAKRDLPAGKVLTDEDLYLAIPLQKGQLSCRELMRGEVLRGGVSQDGAVMFGNIDSPYGEDSTLRKMIEQRGIDPIAPPAAQATPLPTLSRRA